MNMKYSINFQSVGVISIYIYVYVFIPPMVLDHLLSKLIPAIRNLSYENRLRKLEPTTLKDRRLRGDLIQMFKIMKKMDKCDRYNRFKIILNQVRGHCVKIFQRNYEAAIQRKFLLQ
jgi:hypothetical protein